MYRSFTERIFGGVCGGLGASLRVSPWLLRAAFVIFSLVSLGAGVVLYLALWWLMPMESLLTEHRANPLTLVLALVVVVVLVGGWLAQVSGQLPAPNGTALYWPLALVVLSGVFLLRQVGRRA